MTNTGKYGKIKIHTAKEAGNQDRKYKKFITSQKQKRKENSELMK